MIRMPTRFHHLPAFYLQILSASVVRFEILKKNGLCTLVPLIDSMGHWPVPNLDGTWRPDCNPTNSIKLNLDRMVPRPTWKTNWFRQLFDICKYTDTHIYIYIHVYVCVYLSIYPGKHLDLPALVGGHLRMSSKRGKNEIFFFCIMANFMLYIGTRSIGTCASLLHIIIIIVIIIIRPLLKIFNECRSLTGVGKLNPYWRSSMNVEV